MLYQFSYCCIANYDQLCSLKQHTFIISKAFWVESRQSLRLNPLGRSHQATNKVLAGLHSSLEVSSLPRSCGCCQTSFDYLEDREPLAISLGLFSATRYWATGPSHETSQNKAVHFFKTYRKMSLTSDATCHARSKFSLIRFT